MAGKTVMEMVAEAKDRVENLDVEQVAKELEAGALLVDIREPQERQQASIPGSISAPRGMLEFYADPTLPHHNKELIADRRIVLHCAAGMRSALAADTLQQMGYTNVAHLVGGIQAWQESGRPTEPGE
ncbi:MAG: rhodanese-like domain-containing protein [Actinomycetota bacterium]